jgi:hypothetical protein
LSGYRADLRRLAAVFGAHEIRHLYGESSDDLIEGTSSRRGIRPQTWKIRGWRQQLDYLGKIVKDANVKPVEKGAPRHAAGARSRVEAMPSPWCYEFAPEPQDRRKP